MMYRRLLFQLNKNDVKRVFVDRQWIMFAVAHGILFSDMTSL